MTLIIPRGSYTVETEDGLHLLAMRSSYKSGDFPYLRSGLYRKDNGQPVWTVDWFTEYPSVSPDGRFLIRIESGSEHPHRIGIEFYDRGRSMSRYSIPDLLGLEESDRELDLVSTWDHWKRSSEVDWESGVLTVETTNSRCFSFNVSTGEVIRAENIREPEFAGTAETLDGELIHFSSMRLVGGPAEGKGDPDDYGEEDGLPMESISVAYRRSPKTRIILNIFLLGLLLIRKRFARGDLSSLEQRIEARGIQAWFDIEFKRKGGRLPWRLENPGQPTLEFDLEGQGCRVVGRVKDSGAYRELPLEELNRFEVTSAGERRPLELSDPFSAKRS